jgi:GABA(A) receptor-associated protein|uniref:Autophagy-related protein n=1 Tax=viral metagenome TaxID=1070528 RepID=A0A6C0CZ71_9ZZZZ
MEYKNKVPFEKRHEDALRIKEKFPERIPIIIDLHKSSSTLPPLDKRKYLVTRDLTVGQFIYILRKRMKLNPEKAIFLFVNNTIPPTSEMVSEIYREHMDLDNFLYFTLSSESVYG